MQDFEQLGALHLGASYDLLEQKRLEDLVLYDSRHLTTHALCVGMTGSGVDAGRTQGGASGIWGRGAALI